MIKITEDNYKGYVELYKTFCFSMEERNKVTKHTFLSFVVLFVPLIILLLANVSSSIIFSMIMLSILIPYCVEKGALSKIVKDKKEKVSLLYPNIDGNISKAQLEYTLKRAKILKQITENDCQYNELDVSGYEQFLKCEKLKQQVLEQKKYDIAFENSITDEEMERVKVKVKTLIKK